MPRLPLLQIVKVAAVAAAISQSAAQELDTLKANTDKWIQVRSRLATERSNWHVEKQILENGIATLQATKEALRQDVVHYRAENEELAEQSEAAKKRIENLESSATQLLSSVREYERRILALANRLPPPLRKDLAQLVAKIPNSTAPSDIALPNRLQNVVAILTLIDKFNNELRLTQTIKEIGAEEAIEVRVLYWGLAVGYATDKAGERAWILSPSSGAWKWTPAPESRDAIARLFSVYEKAIDPALVAVPFSFSTEEERDENSQ